ncbi:gamma-glutamyltransferase [Alphaproteobacteria bacterium]|nr:gamma-glutamyltransferase [Alphaproteobacteria bacterium]MDB2640953.1 gamma-glutamyltransferase [Alphaproteobacteria bacterium]
MPSPADQPANQSAYQSAKPSVLAMLAMVALMFAAPFLHLQYLYLSHHWRLAPTGGYGAQAMVVSAHRLASEVGRDVLAQGGNAFDAAVAVNFALAVVYQQAGNIGGGGFMVYRLADGTTGTLDFRERAPFAAKRDMYLDDKGEVIKGLSLKGHLAVGVPGSVAGMATLHERFGSKPWDTLIRPSVTLAAEGFILTEKAAREFNRFQRDFAAQNRFAPPVLKQGGWRQGERIKFPALARTLETISQQGRAGFYEGRVADLLVDEMVSGGGLITHQDLAAYTPVWRAPVRFNYRGHEIISMPPPSSGGVALAQLFKGAEAFDIASLGHNSAAHIHLMTELQRRVYADRATHLGDTDFVAVDIAGLTAPDYIAARNADISPTQKTPSEVVKPGYVAAMESAETTHFSIVDAAGNAVAITTTLNGMYGAKVVVLGAGFFLNNEMDDFAIKPGHANQFGLLGDSKNAIAPGKRMLSSMTPTIVTKDGKLRAVVGTPGGATIITSVFQTLSNMIDFNMSAAEAVHARKSHSQWQPDVVMLEKGSMSLANMRGLSARGHRLYPYPYFKWQLGRVEAILVHEDGTLEGAADASRGFDDWAAGY